NNQLFFRANRKTIIHKDAVDQIEKIENGKLTISLKVCKDKEAFSKINISRYKRKEFLDWME
ncbi:LytTR family transcriptional regulator DNA-binding domain-containing protein, partial [Gelidibacter mesophilus]|uniref:LytTR family transcriptional regulator DNA-binding domain-containing protein n=1 Tax=Gelidibacter mesophilus TaxID=169050 RepID=UPI00055251D1